MTDKELHRNTLIFAGVVIVALLIWAYVHNAVFGQGAGSGSPSVTQAGSPVFVVTGSPTTLGPINFPASTFNIPPAPVNGVYNPSSCECGCSGANESVTFSFPDMSGYFTALQQANNAAINAAFGLATAAMPYDEDVLVSNNTTIVPFT